MMIASVGCTYLGLTTNESGGIELFQRTWCCFEVYATIKAGGRIGAIAGQDDWRGVKHLYYKESCPCLQRFPAVEDIEMEQMQSFREEDKHKIIAYLDAMPGGMQLANLGVRLGLSEPRRMYRIEKIGRAMQIYIPLAFVFTPMLTVCLNPCAECFVASSCDAQEVARQQVYGMLLLCIAVFLLFFIAIFKRIFVQPWLTRRLPRGVRVTVEEVTTARDDEQLEMSFLQPSE